MLRDQENDETPMSLINVCSAVLITRPCLIGQSVHPHQISSVKKTTPGAFAGIFTLHCFHTALFGAVVQALCYAADK